MQRVTYVSLDAFRGLAALWVVADHSALETVSLRFPELRTNPLYAISILGLLGVQMFFVISGFCIANAAVSGLRRGSGTAAFIKARLRRIYPPYLCALAAVVAMAMLAGWLVDHHYLHGSELAKASPMHHSLLWSVSQLTLTQVPLGQAPIMIVFWTLCYEIAFYMIVAVLLITAQTSAPGRVMLLLHTTTLLTSIALAIVPLRVPFPLDLWPQFGLGILAYDFIAGRRPWVFALAIAAALGVFLIRFNNGGDHWHVGSRTMFSFALAFAAVLVLLHPLDLRVGRWWLMRSLGRVGIFSYSLYLIHMLPVGVMLQLGRPLLTSPGRFLFLYLAQIVAAVAVAFPFFWLCERPFLSNRASTRVRAEAANAAGPVGVTAAG